MYALALGVQHIDNALPPPVYGLLSGMNSSTVGIIALAAVQLADKAIQDKFSRILVIFGACAGMCYNTLWYFPLLMAIGGLAAVIWHGWLRQTIRTLKTRLKRTRANPEAQVEETSAANGVSPQGQFADDHGLQRRNVNGVGSHAEPTMPRSSIEVQQSQQISSDHAVRVRVGIAIVVLFFGMFFFRLHVLDFDVLLLIYLRSLLYWHTCRPRHKDSTTHCSGPFCQYVSSRYNHLRRRTGRNPAPSLICRRPWMGFRP
jgi:chromate transport protein ChrA